MIANFFMDSGNIISVECESAEFNIVYGAYETERSYKITNPKYPPAPSLDLDKIEALVMREDKYTVEVQEW